MPFTLGGQPYLFGYKGDGTKTAIDKIRPGGTGSTEIWSAQTPWKPGWTSIVPFTLGGQPYLFDYKKGDETAAIDKVKPDGRGTEEIWRHASIQTDGPTISPTSNSNGIIKLPCFSYYFVIPVFLVYQYQFGEIFVLQ